MKKVRITLIGEPMRRYGMPVLPGDKVNLVKEPNNPADNEAIEVHCLRDQPGAKIGQLEKSGKFGYVANSVQTKANGTWSAGRLYDKIEDLTQATVLFIKENCIIAEVEL